MKPAAVHEQAKKQIARVRFTSAQQSDSGKKMADTGKKESFSKEMKALREDILQKHFRRVYLFYGEEEYLVQQYRRELIRAVCGEDDSMNLNIHREDRLDWGVVQDEILSMPFFADYRLVVLDDTRLFASGRKKGAQKEDNDDEPDAASSGAPGNEAENEAHDSVTALAADFLARIPETTVVLFTEHADVKKQDGQKGKSSVDRRGRLYKAVLKNGLAVEFSSPDEQTIRKWVMGKFGAEKIRITGDALNLFLEMAGSDMSHISAETEKLISCAGQGGVIRAADVSALTSEILEEKVFRMIDLITQKERREALELYRDLVLLKVAPNKIFALLVRHFDQLLAAASILEDHGSQGRVMEELGLKRWQADKLVRQARWFSVSSLRRVLERCADMQRNAQSGQIDMRLGLELLILELSGK